MPDTEVFHGNRRFNAFLLAENTCLVLSCFVFSAVLYENSDLERTLLFVVFSFFSYFRFYHLKATTMHELITLTVRV